MAAGVPIQRPVAGIAMGMLLKDNEYTCDDDVSYKLRSCFSLSFNLVLIDKSSPLSRHTLFPIS